MTWLFLKNTIKIIANFVTQYIKLNMMDYML